MIWNRIAQWLVGKMIARDVDVLSSATLLTTTILRELYGIFRVYFQYLCHVQRSDES